MLKGDLDPRALIEKYAPIVKKLEDNVQNKNKYPLGEDASKLHKFNTIETQYLVKYLTDKLSPDEKITFKKKVKHLTNLLNNAPKKGDKPRVFLPYTSREGHIGNFSDPEASFSNAGFTAHLHKYWQDQGCEVIRLDASGGNACLPVEAREAFEGFKTAGFFAGGGPDPIGNDPYLNNFKQIVNYADQKKMPYMTECLTMQMLGMIYSGEKDYLKYVDVLKDRAAYSPGNISVLDTKDMEAQHMLYKEPLASFLRDRDKERLKNPDIEPIKVISVHNNIIDLKKKMKDRIAVSAYSADAEKCPEVLTKRDDDGKLTIVGTQFHPGDLISGTSKNLRKINKASDKFNYALIDTSINEIKDYHKKHVL